nr:maturase [Thurnia sphaerocephala]
MQKEGSKFRPLTVVLPIEKIMKESMRMVLSCIYDGECVCPSAFGSGQGFHSCLRRLKEEFSGSDWFFELDIRKCFSTMDGHRLISILKEEIDDSKFLDFSQKVFSSGGQLVGDQWPSSVPQSVVLSALAGKIYLKKLDLEIGRMRQKHEIPLVQRIRSFQLRRGRGLSEEEKVVEEGSFKAAQERRSIQLCRFSRMQGQGPMNSLLSSWHTAPFRRSRRWVDQQSAVFFPPSSSLASFLKKPSSLLFSAFLKEGKGWTRPPSFHGREGLFHPNWSMRDLLQSFQRRGLQIELGRSSRLVIRSERGLSPEPSPFPNSFLIRISYARYADDLLLGMVGSVFLLIEIEKGLTHFLQSGLKLRVGSVGSRRIAGRTRVEFLGTLICSVPPRTSPRPFLRELEKRRRVKHRLHLTACHLGSAIHSKLRDLGSSMPIKELTKGLSRRPRLLDAVRLAETLGKEGLRSAQVSLFRGTRKHIREGFREISFLHSSGRTKQPSDQKEAVSASAMSVLKKEWSTHFCPQASGEGLGQRAGSFSSQLPIQIEAPIKKIVRRLRHRGLISRRRPRPIHVASLTNLSDGDIVNWFAGIAISLLKYYRCCDNLEEVRRIVDYQIRWSAIFTLAHKHKSSAMSIILKYSKDLIIVHHQGGQTLAEFPKSIDLAKQLGSTQDPKKDGALHSILKK